MKVLAERGDKVGTRAVCGYLRKDFMMQGSQVAALCREVLDCAQKYELSVDKIFVQEVDRKSDQLVECLYAILGADEPILIVPSLLHLAAYGNPIHVKCDFERQGIRVLIARTTDPNT
jgi:hypothetical protein